MLKTPKNPDKGTTSKGAFLNLAPYRRKLSIILRMFRTINIITIRLINPLYFWVGDYPESIDICLTELGENDRVLLYFLDEHLLMISLMHG